MTRTKAEAQQLADRIRKNIGKRIAGACADSIVLPRFLAGLISVENAHLDPKATRFERHVYNRLRAVRSRWRISAQSYNGVTQQQLAGATEDMLVDFATSFCYTQIMGWHVINDLKGSDNSSLTIEVLRDPDQHLQFAVQLLQKVAWHYLAAQNWPAVLRIWNTGRWDGKTFDPNYVDNALAVLRAY